MRTNIVLDDELVREALQLTGLTTKKQVVHRALARLIESEQEARRLASYGERAGALQRKTAGLVLRARAHDLVRADRERR